MKKELFLVAVCLLFLVSLLGCAEKAPEKELEDEMNQLSDEDDARLAEDIRDDGEIAGQAFSGIARLTNQIAAGKTECQWVCTCDGPASQCCKYKC